MSRTRLIFDALWPTLLMWLVLVVIAVWKDASLPSDRDGWAQFLVLCLVIEFLTVKSFLMARRMREWNWLTVSLIAANACFAVVYLSVATRTLWPEWYGRHVEAIRWATYVSLCHLSSSGAFGNSSTCRHPLHWTKHRKNRSLRVNHARSHGGPGLCFGGSVEANPMTNEQLADALMQLALAAQTLGYVLRQIVSPADKVATDGLEMAQLEINDVMATSGPQRRIPRHDRRR
jgi:hypothetical protein